MTERIIFDRREKRCFSIPQFSKEEVTEMEKIGESQLKNHQYGLILDSPQAIQKFKAEVRNKYGVHC